MIYNKMLIIGYEWKMMTLVGGENFTFYFIYNYFFTKEHILFLHLEEVTIRMLPLKKEGREGGRELFLICYGRADSVYVSPFLIRGHGQIPRLCKNLKV